MKPSLHHACRSIDAGARCATSSTPSWTLPGNSVHGISPASRCVLACDLARPRRKRSNAIWHSGSRILISTRNWRRFRKCWMQRTCSTPLDDAVTCYGVFGRYAAVFGGRSATTPPCSPAVTATRLAPKSATSSATYDVCGNRAALSTDSDTLGKILGTSVPADKCPGHPEPADIPACVCIQKREPTLSTRPGLAARCSSVVPKQPSYCR